MPTTGWDKIDHVLAFFVLAILGCRGYSRYIFFAMLGLVFFGGLIEILQSFTSYRSAEWADLAADIAGLVVGWGSDVLLRKVERSGRL